ncbi:putative kinesin [Leishmania major strain Friedlin]|uniref:Putative kinesin n=1 Tax=Leishmania major TaxID=5664 RepID=E9AEA1_LEIMA|nr:putative kinesin [Leishmania major strain Friedlin]CAG9577980.1 kinesin_-_putative [Leishmania major strain Friedlin]CBZ12580.1 putative kinesin [Leishmania major strain Friedlin]|eukprot:XP_003722322.1 putative kinesin [Leishmania major strain Friedlin]
MSDDAKSRVQVSLRIRPVKKGVRHRTKVVVRGAEGGSVVVDDEQRTKRAYHFDHVFSGDQAEVFEAIGRPMLREAYKGFNVCLFAYGQTGSGKTYSLLGDLGCEERAGVAPRFVRCLFDEAQRMVDEDADLTIKVSLSMIEVYMEKVRDLLAPRQRGQEPESLEIHEDPSRRVYVRGASVHQVLSAERMMELLRKGNANRQTAETRMNETSSRSHAIMQISLSQEFACVKKKDLECVVSLVDLAGSERQTKTESSGQQFEEAKKINHSLLMLGRALNSFSDRKGSDAFISLRESKLTRLLSESFGGNSKTWMLATVSPTAFNLTESISTLDYATNAMAITNKAKVNSIVKSLELKELKAVVSSLEKQLESLAAARDANEVDVSILQEEREALRLAVHTARSQGTAVQRLQSTLQHIQLSNIALRRRVEAAEKRIIWSLDNEASFLFYKGRCAISLRGVLCGEKRAYRLALLAENGQATSTTLHVQVFSLSNDLTVREDPMELVGRSIKFCLRIVGAEGLPPQFCRHSFCKLSLLFDQDNRYFTTSTAEDTANPRWDLIKRFELPHLSPEVIAHFSTHHLFTFEVFGFST